MKKGCFYKKSSVKFNLKEQKKKRAKLYDDNRANPFLGFTDSLLNRKNKSI